MTVVRLTLHVRNRGDYEDDKRHRTCSRFLSGTIMHSARSSIPVVHHLELSFRRAGSTGSGKSVAC